LKYAIADVVCLKPSFIYFFLCPFVKASWFLKPWFLRSEVFTQNVNSFAEVLHTLLSMNHPKANLNFIATFLWCIWKERNDQHFGRKKMKPEQIAIHAKALLLDLESTPLLPSPNKSPRAHEQIFVKSGETVSAYFHVSGLNLYVDASWKLRPNQSSASAGLGLYLAFPEQGNTSDVLVSASSLAVASPI
jgi:hypothetical protein